MIQATGADLNDDLVRGGLWIGNVAQFKCSRLTVGHKLERFHIANLQQGAGAGKSFALRPDH